MNSYFSIGELSRHQNISRQTLIYYDKIGLFCPAWVDPHNGYRYYSPSQLEQLDTILLLKKIGFSLEEIGEHMAHYTMESSIAALEKHLESISRQIKELQMIKSRVGHRCQQMRSTLGAREERGRVQVEMAQPQCLLMQPVAPPHRLEDVSLATKQCFVRAFREQLPIYFQSGAIVPYDRIQKGEYTRAAYAFLPIGPGAQRREDVQQMPGGRWAYTYHIGDYASIGKAYQRILEYCQRERLEICSDSYEFAMNDYLSTGDEGEYITKVLFYIR